MKTGIINSKTLLRSNLGYRIDPDVHLSDGVQAREQLTLSPYDLSTVGENASKVFLGNIFSRVFVKDIKHGMPYLAASDTVLANIETGRYLSHKQVKKLKYLILKSDWILITCSGTLGNVIYTNKTFENHIATHDLIRVIPNDNKVNKGTLYAFLSGKYGYNQITQSQFGGVVKHINDVQTKSILVPVFPESFQQEVDDLIQESARLREEAADVLQQAIQQIEKIIPYPAKKNVKCVSSRTILSSHNKRFEANYYISEGHDIEEYIYKHFTWKPLGEVCEDISRPDIFKRYYVQNGIVFLGGADIFLSNPDSKKQLSKSKTANINSLTIKENTILIPRSGTIGNVAWAHAGHAQKLASEHVIRLQPNDMLKGGYIYAFLSSSIGKALIQKHIFGSVIQHIEPPHLKLIPIPIIEDSIIDDIHNWVIEYSKKVGMAIEKEKKAISMVEQEIDSWSARKEN
ncbi:restriction endonuclease subunit S [Bacteroides sp. Marseille-P3684]|uniref:methylation-associated defense system restriction endonuclease subunit S MAD5 n=1 Tax=Bacteroides sp. Marseille-P3684 TaxID=2086579 RepID=UPI000D0BA2BF|nr:restriction endonuclease subunit S [Bacteroides sp. Marseille-P3684]